MDTQVTISLNQLILVALGAAVSYGVMLTNVITLKKDLREHMLNEAKLLEKQDARIRELENKEIARTTLERAKA